MNTLRDAIQDFGTRAYLLTSAPEGPHTAHMDVDYDRSSLTFKVGGTSVVNAESNPNVSLFWPPIEPGGYSIVVNGKMTWSTEGLATLAITKAVFHRPGRPTVVDGPCGSDCLPLSLGEKPTI